MNAPGFQDSRTCRECGAPVPQDSDFCFACGAMFRDSAPRGAPEQAFQDAFPDDGTFSADPASINSFIRSSMEGVADTVSMLVLFWGAIALT